MQAFLKVQLLKLFHNPQSKNIQSYLKSHFTNRECEYLVSR